MGQSKRFVLSDLGGGLNQGVDPTDIKDTEFQDLLNFYPWQKRLIKRDGCDRISGPGSSNRYFEETTGGFPYKTAVGNWTLIVGGQTSIGKLSGSSLVKIPHVDNTVFTSSDEPWSFSQYKDIIYGTRKDVASLQRSDGTTVGDAGIAAPSSAPTMADGGAGNLDAGDYIAVVTFYNSASGAESNPSDVSSTLTLGANKQIAWTNIPVSDNEQVTSRRLYRTLVDQQGVYYLVDEIADNLTTTYTDNVIETALGIDVSFDNGVPPPNLHYNVIWQERLWATDETDLFYSELALPESHGDFSFLQVSPDDGHQILGILPFGDKLIVGKTNKTFIVSGVDRFEVQSLSNAHGCHSHHSMKSSEGSAFWFGGDNFYRSDGNAVKGVGDVKVRDLVDGIDLTYATRIVSSIDAKKGWYLSIVPSAGASEPDKLLVYNYRDDAWTIFDYEMADANDGAPSWIADFFDSTGASTLYGNLQGGDEDSVFEFNTGVNDDGRNITASFTTKSFGYDKEDIMKFMKDISVQASIIDQNAVVTLLKDNNVVSDLGAKTYSLSGGRLWKRVPLANNGDPAVSMAFKFAITGTKACEVLGISFKIVDLERTVPVSEFI
jgi:hypothetical protein